MLGSATVFTPDEKLSALLVEVTNTSYTGTALVANALAAPSDQFFLLKVRFLQLKHV